MTDTDDTDDLLLIPPDFFAVKSDSESSDVVQPYYSIVDNLIRQVGCLQNRIRSIESSDSFLSNCLDYSLEEPHDMHNSIRSFRKYNSSDDLYDSKSTPEVSPKVNSVPNTPYLDRFAAKHAPKVRSPYRHALSPKVERKPARNEDGNATLNEIDMFLSKVKTIQRLNAARNLEAEFNDAESRLDVGQKTPEKPLEKPAARETTWQCGDTSASVPDLGAGVKSTLYKPEPFIEKSYSTGSSLLGNDSMTSVDRYPASESSTDSTQVTAYKRSDRSENLVTNPIHSNAINILNRHKKLLEDSTKKRVPKPRSVNTISNNLGLMNLADIWGNNETSTAQATQKLQEEKLRRQHCENLIQELQNRNLELQQKLSVAVQVDESKNKVINQFQEALEKVMVKMKAVQRDKKDWEGEINAIRNKHKTEMEDLSQKISYYEKELSRALNLVQINQEKSSSFEQKFSMLQNELHFVDKKYKDCEDILKRESDRNKQLTEILGQKEIEINENKNIVNTARSEVAKSKEAIESCQEEFLKLKLEHEKLQENFRTETERVEHLEEQKRNLMREKDESKKRENFLQDEIIKMQKQLESNKLELRNFYQGQVEILVQNKLKDFQSQLEQSENSFKEELKKKEMAIAKTAASHIQQISDKYTLEIKLLEKKHQEEIKLYQIQVMQEKRHIESLQARIDQFQQKRVLIAKQLQKIMETQWTEALRIIASGKSPTLQDSFSTIDQLNCLKTRSYSNVEEVLAQQGEPLDLKGIERDSNNVREDVGAADTPVSSRSQHKLQDYKEEEVQKYITLLLSKPQATTTSEEISKFFDRMLKEGRETFSIDRDEAAMGSLKASKDKRLQKPPWK